MKIISIIILLVAILGTIFTEMYLRYVGLGDPIRYDSDYIYGYAPKINQKKQRINGSVVTINDIGLRTKINWKNDKRNKIVFFGDSITYGGSYIDDDETFVSLVCKKLEKFLCGNAGVNAYGVINIINRSKFDQRLNDSDIVIFVLAPGDFYREYANSNTAHFYLNKKKFKLPAIFEAISFIATKYDLNNKISKLDDTTKLHKKELINFSVEYLKNEIVRLKQNKKKVIIFYTIEKNDPSSLKSINKFILELISKKNIDFINLNTILNKKEYFYDNVHYSQKGHEIVSKEIIKTVVSILN